MKTVLITGASKGFGRLISVTLAGKGYNVYASMRGVDGKNSAAAQELRDLAKRENLNLNVIELDVTNQSSVDKAVEGIVSTTGSIDIVVNNAGIGSGGPLEANSIDNVQRVFDVNVWGVLRVNRAVLPYMRKKGEGLIIAISSIMGRVVIPFSAAYTASKFALEGFIESLRYEVSQLGVDVVSVEPGAFPTQFGESVIAPDDAKVVAEYGDLANSLNKVWTGLMDLFQSPEGPKAQEVADAVLQLVETRAGERPTRVVVDRFMGDGPRDLNIAADKLQEGMLGNMGLGHLRKIQEKAGVA